MLMNCKNIKRSFPAPDGTPFYALKGVSIDIPKQSLVILKGRSGSGKTTLMNILGALDLPTEGEVLFEGTNICNLTEEDRENLRRYKIGFVFQSIGLVPMMSAYENVEFALRMTGKTDVADERIRESLSMVGLLDRANHRPIEMSGGEQQRIAIARAMVHKPQIIFADEPTGALDTTTGLSVMKIFKKMIETDGSTIVMTTHDPNMMEFGDVVYEIEDGEIVGK